MDKITYREELTLEADKNVVNIDISKDIKHIKNKMKEYVECRSFTVHLIKARSAVAVSEYCPNIVNLFIPNLVSPLHYRQLFIDEFTKLGFTEECIELSISEYDTFDYYDIKLTW
jgi:hypothetical protein